MMNENSLKFRFMAIRFSMWDLHLYLDTHPEDAAAKALLKKYEAQYAVLLDEYTEKYGPLTPSAQDSGAEWLRAPWPWNPAKEAC